MQKRENRYTPGEFKQVNLTEKQKQLINTSNALDLSFSEKLMRYQEVMQT